MPRAPFVKLRERNAEEIHAEDEVPPGRRRRFEVRKNGKLRRRRSGHNHMLEKKRAASASGVSNTETYINPKDEKRIKRLLG